MNNIFPVFLVSLVLFGLSCIGLLCYDSFFLPDSESWGVIIDKEYFPEHYELETGYDIILKIYVTHNVFYPAVYKVWIEIDEQKGSLEINEKLFNKLSTGSEVLVIYSIGRLSKDLYIKRIKQIED